VDITATGTLPIGDPVGDRAEWMANRPEEEE